LKKIAILQSNYIPWKGYFDLIAAVDEFVIFDDMQYTRRDWRNRNRIKTRQGVQWLTVPVQVKGKFLQKIRDTEIAGSGWAQDHWKALLHSYRQAAHFDAVAAWLEPIYAAESFTHLSALNRRLLVAICTYLGIPTVFANSWDYPVETEDRTQRLAEICTLAGATEYLSGPAARSYIEEDVFAARGIKLTWFDYPSYSAYPQLWGDFVHEVSILDLLFNCGKESRRYMRGGVS
jgi:hypothetical protein